MDCVENRRSAGARQRPARNALEHPALRPVRTLAGFVLFFASGVGLCLAYGLRDRPIVADTQLYYFISERVAAGVAPHVSQVDIKTSLGPILSGMAMKAGRLAGADDVSSARAASIASASITVALAFLLALELTGSVAGGVVAGAVMLTTRGLFVEAVTGCSPKVFLTPFLLLACLAAAKRRWMLCGAAGAASLAAWQPGASVLIGAGVALLLDRRARAWDLARLVAGAALTMIAYEGYFAFHGALAEQIHQEFVLAFNSDPRAFDFAKSLWFFLTESREFQTLPNPAPVVFFAIAAVTGLFALLRPTRAVEIGRSEPGLVAFWVSAAVGTMFTFLDHQAHPDMLLVQPHFAVACGIGFAWLANSLSRTTVGRLVAGAACAALVLLCAARARSNAEQGAVRAPTLSDQIELASLINVYRDHRRSVWVVGAAHLLGLEHSDNHVPHAYLAGPITREIDFATYRPLRDGSMPEVIVVSRGIVPGHAWLKKEYDEITPAAFAAQRTHVYGRRHPGSTGPEAVAFSTKKNGR